ncbi:MAG: membrane-bound alpha-1,6- mannosyltransferase Initiation-specific [Candelina submexicana]|nr:MAG: membrane-bound alpha-1,6- mannosyltransferase Initiation-specific [Candelina submexicana]
MLTPRKSVIVAAFVLTFFYLLRSSHTPRAPIAVPDLSQASADIPASKAATANKQQTTGLTPDKPITSGTSGVHTLPLVDKKPAAMQQTLADLSGKPLRQQLAYQFPYDVEGKFPGYIWQTWKYTPASGEFGENFRPSEASWSEMHPGFVHEVVTDQVAVHLMKHLYASVPDVLEAYNSLPLPIMKADFFRYLILLARGGIYADIDTAAIKSAADWIPEDVPRSTIGLVIGIEADPDRPDWQKWYSRRIQFCQWTIQAKAGHPVLRDLVASITKETLKRKKAGTLDANHKSVVEFTGPAVWTDKVFAFFNNADYFDMSTSRGNITWENFTGIKQPKRVGDVIVLPITSFSPGVQQMGAGEDDDPMAFVKHEFEGTWKPEEERKKNG